METLQDAEIIPSTSAQETASDARIQESTTPGEVLATTTEAPKKPSPLAQKLAGVIASANKQYGLKKYAEAADLYAQAAEIQDSINGEGNPQNADVLYYYGRALFQCALSKSDILGDSLGQQESSKKDTIAKQSTSKNEATAPTKKGFSFQGDENFLESDDEDTEAAEGEEVEGEEEEEEDDFSLAFGILDHARTLYIKRLDSPPEDKTQAQDLEKRLADIYDLLGEIALESESFSQAVTDLTSALKLKEALYPEDSTIMAEAHYKLSLALEFASQNPPDTDMTEGNDAGEGSSSTAAEVEKPVPISEEEQKAGRELSAKHTKLAIQSCQKRIVNEEKSLDTAADKTVVKKSLDEAKDLVKELEQRLKELMAPPPTRTVEDIESERQNAVNSVLQSMMAGADPAAAKKILEQAISGATDLGSVVRKKPKLASVQEGGEQEGAAASPAAASSSVTGKKRKADDEKDKVAEKTEESEGLVGGDVAESVGVNDLSSKKVRITTEEEESAATM